MTVISQCPPASPEGKDPVINTADTVPEQAAVEPTHRDNRSLVRMAKAMAIAAIAFTVWRYAWISDDILITLRTSLNWEHGHGPVFNPGERVAGYTHPLWFLVLSVAGMLSDSWIYGTLWICIALSIAALSYVIVRTRNWWQFATVASCLLLSNTIADWSTSGLETPLAAVLFCALFAVGVARTVGHSALLGMLVGLLLLTRLDFAVLLAPWLVSVLIWGKWSLRQWQAMAVTICAPLLAWFAFAYWYYGYALPATFAAKTNVEIPVSNLLRQGTGYILGSFGYDIAAGIFIVSIVILSVISQNRTLLTWSAGSIGYLGYVVWVGGDFMLGRFLYIPMLVLMLALTETSLPVAARIRSRARRGLFAVPLVIVIAAAPQSVALSFSPSDKQLDSASAYMDERLWWTQLGRSLNPLGQYPDGPWAYPSSLKDLDAAARSWPSQFPALSADRIIVGCGGLAATAFVLPSSFVVDQCGLTDRFLGAQPFVLDPPDSAWKAGHLHRPVPEGYLEAILHGDPSRVQDPELAEQLSDIWQRTRTQ